MTGAQELQAYVVEQLRGLEDITWIPMMGGYIFYIKGRIFGGIYGKGFMVKITESSKRYMPDSEPESPYEGAKEMLPVTIMEDKEKFREMVASMYEELPEPKPKKTKIGKSILTTKRLKIKALGEKELEQCIANEQDRHMKEALTEMLEGMKSHPKDWLWYTQWEISLKKGTVIGSLGFKGPVEKGEVEVGYGIDEAYRGKGYATEAVKAAIDWAFKEEAVAFVMAETEPDNEASQRVLHKLDFIQCGEGQEGPRFERRRWGAL